MFIVCLFCSLVFVVSAKLFFIEVENYAPKGMRRPRSSASGNFSVHLREGQSLVIDFCLREESRVRIRDIVYSNDGFEDSVFISIDRKQSGAFLSTLRENRGNGWNIFRSTGAITEIVTLRTGRHTIFINATKTDSWGIEIDYVLLEVNDILLEYTDLFCHLYCFDDISYDAVPRKDSIPSGRFVQKSVETQCAEQDNIHVEVYNDNANDFEIVANLPKYVSFSNNREPRYDNCKLGSPYWLFKNISIMPGQMVDKSDAKLRMSGTQTRTRISVTFNLDSFTESRELDERMLGTKLTAKLRNMPRTDVRIIPKYMKNGATFSLPIKVFTPFNVEQSWNIPDRSWSIQGQNNIRLEVISRNQIVILDSLSLKKQTVAETPFEIYSDTDIVIEGVRLGFWHHWDDQPSSMTINLSNFTHKKVDSIRIYSRVPWTGGYSQTFVLFQDGRVRLQAVAPHGLDYVPFGSSVFIGQPKNPNQSRPYSPIKSITIYPSTLRMAVKYVNGNKATFILKTSSTQTRLIVKKAVFRMDRSRFPLLSFKSMWINDGNSDVDHMTINGGVSRHVMSGWKELYGISSVFFRKCISRHNTQGPDLTIQFLAPSDE